MSQVLVEIIHEDVPGLLLNLIGPVRAPRLCADKNVAVNRMIETGPLHVLARFLRPFVR